MKKLTRKTSWRTALAEYLDRLQSQKWDDVSHNCATFAAGAIQAMTGENPAADLGIEVQSAMDVARVLVSFGGVRGIATEYLGNVMPPLWARTGDIVIRDGEDGESLGVMDGAKAIFLTKDGPHYRSLSECAGAWRVA